MRFIDHDDGVLRFTWRHAAELLDAVCGIFKIVEHPDADGAGVTRIVPDHRRTNHSSPLGFTHHELNLHTDGSATSNPAEYLLVAVEQAASYGGDAIVADCTKAYAKLSARAKNQLEESFSFAGTMWPVYMNNADQPIFRYRSDGQLLPQTNASAKALDEFRTILLSNSCQISLPSNHGYLVKNHTWTHGRTTFQGDRIALRILLDRR
ncbi:TauD/TfdA family dioxygenase [Flexivirga caeni]